MLFRNVAKLISVEHSVNSIGDATQTTVEREVFVNKKGVRSNEFYQAMATGLRPEVMLEVRTVEYNGEPRIRYGDKVYNIIRTYDRNGEITELICQGMTNKAKPSVAY